jgi:ribosomal protein L11 methyltransferase
MNYYKEFTVTAEPFVPEIISSLLWELDISGINEEVNCLKIFAPQSAGLTVEQMNEVLQRLVNEKLLRNYYVEENLIEDKNWNEEWKKNIQVMKLSERIVIKPTFRDYSSSEGEIVITLDPKMSFGTGEHQTTRLMVKALEKYIKPGDKVLDIGSGTGILAIAAVKLGASSALGIDNDEWCLMNGIENCRLNLVDDKVKIRLAEITQIDEKEFDLIAANIQKNVLLNIAEKISAKLKKEGTAILSGLLDYDTDEVISHYKKCGMNFLDKYEMGEWAVLIFKN